MGHFASENSTNVIKTNGIFYYIVFSRSVVGLVLPHKFKSYISLITTGKNYFVKLLCIICIQFSFNSDYYSFQRNDREAGYFCLP